MDRPSSPLGTDTFQSRTPGRALETLFPPLVLEYTPRDLPATYMFARPTCCSSYPGDGNAQLRRPRLQRRSQ